MMVVCSSIWATFRALRGEVYIFVAEGHKAYVTTSTLTRDCNGLLCASVSSNL